MNNVEDNYFRDPNSLVHGCFPHQKEFSVYMTWRDDKNRFTDQGFPAKMQTASLPAIVMYIICHVGMRDDKFCFDRCLKRVLQQRWPDAVIE
jgi:hypothetical protein